MQTQIAAYYFPNYHFDPRNALVHGAGWNEWQLVKEALPRFPGHRQPRVPLWGYEDESDPEVMAVKIAAAADHGLDAFIFDWYYYNDGPFLERALTHGFQQAPNAAKLRYALMWANHDWTDIHPFTADKGAPRLLYPGTITPEAFDRMTDYIIERHFQHPSYWKVEGCPYFSVYEISRLAAGFGSWQAVDDALSRFREKTCAAGFPGLHLNGIIWGLHLLPGEQSLVDPAGIIAKLKFDSVTSYVWVHHYALKQFPVTDYQSVFKENQNYWRTAQRELPVDYFPNVTMGWDSSPRTNQKQPFTNSGYPFCPTVSTTPREFGVALRSAGKFVMDLPPSKRIITINAWNEWTEGSYLEPDQDFGYAYLKQVAAAKEQMDLPAISLIPAHSNSNEASSV